MEPVPVHRRAAGRLRPVSVETARLLLAAVLICAGLVRAAPAQQGAAAPPMRLLDPAEIDATDAPDTLRTTPTTLRRLVRRFSFEESELRPLDMPINFYRFDAPDRGFPPFGEMSPSDQLATHGRWSFAFELNGGSLAARVPTGVLPTVPFGHYIINVDVRTEQLRHSAARLVAWMTDSTGRSLPASRVHSPPTRSNGRWTTLTVQLDAEMTEATDLVIELQLVQPREYMPEAKLIAPGAEDINGRAWFDNLMIWHAPMIEMTTGRPGNVIMPHESPTLSFKVRDLSSEPLSATLRVFDIDGAVTFQRRFERGFNLSTQRTVELGDLPAGWYRAVLDLNSPQGTVGRQWLDLVVLAPLRSDQTAGEPTAQFGIEIAPELVEGRSDALAIIERAAPGAAVVPIWPTHPGADDTLLDALLTLATELDRRNVQVIVALDQLPPHVAESLDVEHTQVLEAMSADASTWQPHLDHAVLNLGLQVQRWRIGTAVRSSDAAALRSKRAQATRSLRSFVPDPTIMLRRDPERVPDGDQPSAFWLDLPQAVRPAELEPLLEPWMDDAADHIAHVHTLGGPNYAPRQQAIDLAQRALFTWKAGPETIVIDAPWHANGALHEQALPSPMLVVWRNLADRLTQRTFLAKLDAPGAQECWILDSDTRDPALVAWSGRISGAPAKLDLVLAETPVQVIDMFGNRRTVAPGANGRHVVELSESPVFIEGIDPQLAVFRSGFRVEPRTVPSVHELHELELVLRNPWSTTISGTLRLQPDAQWNVNPRVSEFTIAPNDNVRIPIDFIMNRNIVSGPKILEADVEVLSERKYDIRITAGFVVGLNDLHVSASWQRSGGDSGDVTINQYVTNNSEQPVTINAFMHAPGYGPRLRPIGQIRPGATAVQTFHFPGGAAALAGRTIRYGVKQSDGATRVNRVLEIPESAQPHPPAAATAEQP